MKATLITILILLTSLLAACSSSPGGPIKIGLADAGKTIEVKTGDILLIALEGNPTTGFSWIPAAQNPELLQQAGEPEVTPDNGSLGAPGTMVLKFTATAKGQTILHLDYKRAWENTKPEKTFEVTVLVK